MIFKVGLKGSNFNLGGTPPTGNVLTFLLLTFASWRLHGAFCNFVKCARCDKSSVLNPNFPRPSSCFPFLKVIFIYISDGSNYVWSLMFDGSKPKIGCLSLITKRWTWLSSFDVRKNDVWICSISNLVNLVKAILGSMFDVWLFEVKNSVFKFDHQ